MKLELTESEVIEFIRFKIKKNKKLQTKIQKTEAKTSKQRALNIESVIGCFKTLEECEKESIEFTKDKMKVVGRLLSDDYKTGYKEGVEHYLQKHNNL